MDTRQNNEDLWVIQLEDNCESVVLECDQDEDTDSDEIIVGDTEPADEYEQHPYLVEVMIDYNVSLRQSTCDTQ